MEAMIISRNRDTFKVQVEFAYTHDMLAAEEAIQTGLNKAGVLATQEMLELHDTDGSPITIAGTKLTTKGQESKEFQSPYGSVVVERHVYQSAKGGRTYAPLDVGSKVIGTSTPKFAKMISSKYACDGAPGVQRDLAENHNRPVALSFIKNTSDAVGAIALAKEEGWSFELPEMPKSVGAISIGLDGTCLNMMDDGWREAMCGTIAFFDRKGERMHTIYTAASPEYGKETFLHKLGNEVKKVTELYPKIPVVGLADGATSNWSFLEEYADILTIDFWHLCEYLAKAATAMFSKKGQIDEKEKWLEDACHRMKHKMGGASRILNELKQYFENNAMTLSHRETLQSAITYLTNHRDKMQYYKNVDANMPIGSGITEAACKTIVKQRMCKGAARWKDQGATVVLTLRSLHMTPARWSQFWNKYSRYGFQQAA